MRNVGYIVPGGDAAADDLAGWGAQLRALLETGGHPTQMELRFDTPCDRGATENLLEANMPVVFFFGHGDEDALLGSLREPIIDSENLSAAVGKTLVSVACEAALAFGPSAVQAGVRAHLGWNVLLLWVAGDATTYGEAIVRPLSRFGTGGSVSEVADELRDELNGVARRYRAFSPADRNAKLAYYAAAAAAGQIAVDGDRHVRPLSGGPSLGVRWAAWQVKKLAKSVPNSAGTGSVNRILFHRATGG